MQDLLRLGKDFPFHTVSGKTVCTNDFYEGDVCKNLLFPRYLVSNFFLCLGQARLDGAFCSYTEKDKMEYIAWLKEGGVANIEMESTCFAALTYQAGIRSSIVCVALLDRLNEDQVSRDMQ